VPITTYVVRYLDAFACGAPVVGVLSAAGDEVTRQLTAPGGLDARGDRSEPDGGRRTT